MHLLHRSKKYRKMTLTDKEKIEEALRKLDQMKKELEAFQQRNYEGVPFLMELTKQIKLVLES